MTDPQKRQMPSNTLNNGMKSGEATDPDDLKDPREYEAEYQKMLENADEGIWIVDNRYITIFVNQEVANILGLDPDDIIGKPADDFFCSGEQKLFSILKERRLKGFSDHYGIKLAHKEGHPVWATISAFPIRDSVGTISGAFAMVHETKERLQKEERLNQYRIRLERIIDLRTGELRLAKEKLEKEIEHRIEIEKELRDLNTQLMDESEERKELSKRLIDMLEKDRLEIASDLHDRAGQILTTLRMDMEKFINQTEVSSPGLLDTFGEMMEKIDRSAFIIKNISKGLRPTTLDRLGLVPSIRILLKEIIETSTLEINFHHDEVSGGLKAGIDMAIYRTVQECLNNVIKHSRAQKVHVNLTVQDKSICLSVEDDGVGFNAAQWRNNFFWGDSFGLCLMRERIIQFGGELTVESTSGNGALIMAHIPLEID